MTACPYKGRTTGYWSIRTPARLGTPTWPGRTSSRRRQLLPIAGLVAFYNEKVDIILDGERLERPGTHFS